MSARLNLQCLRRGPSGGALDTVRALADAVGGFVLDASWLSNLLLSARIDMVAGDVPELLRAAAAAGLEISPADAERVVALDAALPPGADLLCFLAVHCVHDEPDQRRVVPAVPG